MKSYDLGTGKFQTRQTLTQILALQGTSWVILGEFPRSRASPALSAKMVVRGFGKSSCKIVSSVPDMQRELSACDYYYVILVV